ncbi:DUF4177 domain-containing protein [Tranquillimonas alkanivorans]|uniref:DUF4177 domain-containing protein n=1 Tax=Tranquillimonas alkanivorans TaxID=441119 RepID=A0A1I5MA24_9RHOB|nr:DUF4177 domain-containing protein [Tranquillimonas alkanivorans]SFP06422.1 protein of unknown function [Tranquillimonas alkanivorans]
MPFYEYMVVPAPRKGTRTRGVKGSDMRFAHALSELINEHAAEGWEYQRAESLPCDERTGMIGRTTTVQNVLVFRRELFDDLTGSRDTRTYVQESPPPEEMARELERQDHGTRLSATRDGAGGAGHRLGPAAPQRGAVHPLRGPGPRGQDR